MSVDPRKVPALGLVHNAGRCLKSHHQTSSCRQCIDICPQKALSRIESVLSLDNASCRLCGACVSACPTDALELAPAPQEKSWICAQAATAKETSAGCLQQFKPQQLVEFVLSVGSLELVVGDCVRCTRYCASAEVGKLVRKANALLADLGHSAQVSLRSRRPQIDLARRFLFRGWADRLTQDEFLGTASPLRFAKIRDGEAWKRVPQSHRSAVSLLERSLSQTDVAGVLAARLPTFDGNRCAVCPVCVSACPSGALSVSRNGRHLQLSLLARDCIGCGLCAEVCFRQAVTMSKPETLAERLDGHKRVAVSRLPDALLEQNSFEQKTRQIFKVPVYDS